MNDLRSSTDAHAAVRQGRISADEALRMLTSADTAELIGRADEIRRRLHGRRTHFVHSLNINPTNICENRCELCAFWREPDSPEAYVMTIDQARSRMEEAVGWELTDLHVVGGLTPGLDLAFYESFMRMAKEILPGVLVQGMTAVEIHYLADRAGLSVAEVLGRLQAAGMCTLSGGGAEVFSPSIRGLICPNKISAQQWLAVHEQAHAIGLPTNATMLYGHIEAPADIVDHLARLRELQDRTGGFRAFIPLPFHASGSRLGVHRGPGGYTVARVVALSRIFLDNFPHIRVLANYTGRKLLGVLTHAGVDDIGGTSLAERIARAAGAPPTHAFASTEEMTAFLEDLGLAPVLTNSAYGRSMGILPMSSTAILAVRPTGVSPVGVSSSFSSSSPTHGQDARATHGQDGHATVAKAMELAEAGKRISARQAVALHDEAPLAALAQAAHRARLRAVPGRSVTFVLDRNINITNVCEAGCRFCAFHVPPGSDKGYVLSIEQIVDKVVEAVSLGATQVLLQGGLNPDLDLGFYERMLSSIKARADVCLHSLSPAEVLYLSRRSGLGLAETLHRLRAAGLDSLPGGGAEILVDAVRARVSPRKISADDWFAVMAAAQEMGMRTTATMVYGLGETTAQRIEHMRRVRDLQDRTGGFTAFIPWSLQANRTGLSYRPRTGVDYLRVVATARLVLDNIPHIQAGWVTEGPDVAQLALVCGADDFGGILMEESVVRATGVSYTVSADEVISLIRETGMTPVQRTTQYEVVGEGISRRGR
jgi:dehypoxanthine futalosine cyclase